LELEPPLEETRAATAGIKDVPGRPVDISGPLGRAEDARAALVEKLVAMQFTVALLDSDGFKLLDFPVPRSTVMRTVDAQGKSTFLSASGDAGIFCDRSSYLRATAANLRWTAK